MDTEKIRLEVFQRTGKGIDPDDPFFVAVAMLSAVTDNMEHKHASLLIDLRKENTAWREIGIEIKGLVNVIKDIKSKAIAGADSEVNLENLIRRAHNKELEATRWLTRAHEKLDGFLPMLICSSALSGLIGGVIVVLAQHYF